MATLQTQSTNGAPVTVIYPAEKPSGPSALVRFRIGKKTTLPAYADANLPHLVQFDTGRQTVMFMLSDILQTSYWQKIRNAYNLFGQLDIDEDVKVDPREAGRVAEWLRDRSAARGMSPAGVLASCQSMA